MIVKVCQAYADRGGDVPATITRKKRETPPVAPIVTGEVEALLIALACSAPPEGRDRWTLRLLEMRVALTDDVPDLDHSRWHQGRTASSVGTVNPSRLARPGP